MLLLTATSHAFAGGRATAGYIGARRHKPAQAQAISLSPAEQYAAQRAAALREKQEERAKRAYEVELEGLWNGDSEAYMRLQDKNFWRNIIAESPMWPYYGLTIAEDSRASTLAAVGADQSSTSPERTRAAENLRLLLDRGFCGVEGIDWAAHGVDFGSIAAGMEALKQAGWPPVFVFMFDEAWRVCEALFDVVAPLIQDEELVLEASVYGWALDHPKLTEGVPGEKVGGNFGVPHRDNTYSASHTVDGRPSILGIWIPCVDVNADNGCMYVVPRERDPLFENEADRTHRAPHLMPNFPYAHVRPLEANAGTVLMWHHNTIHWGSSCSPYATHPRKSIAMSFRLREEEKPFSAKDEELYGRRPYTRQELAAGIPMDERLRLCTRALMMYSVWHPEFKGFDKEHLGVDL